MVLNEDTQSVLGEIVAPGTDVVRWVWNRQQERLRSNGFEIANELAQCNKIETEE